MRAQCIIYKAVAQLVLLYGSESWVVTGDMRIMCIIFIGSALIDTETFYQVCSKIVSWPYPNQTYGFASHSGLWKIVARVPVFVISPVVINILIGFRAVPQVHCDQIQVNHLKLFLLSFLQVYFKEWKWHLFINII